MSKKLLVLLGVVLLIISFGLGFLLVGGYGKDIEKGLITQIPLPFGLDELVLPIHQKEL